MRLLLDTHALLCGLEDSHALTAGARAAIGSPDSVVYVSAASAWEMSIQRAKGRLDSPSDVLDAMDANRFMELPITVSHAQSLGGLPLHHADPVDRILVVQAMLEGLTIVTRDPDFAAYDVPLLPA